MLRLASISAHRFGLAAILAAGVAMATIGCSDRACIRWKKSSGPCPSALDARRFFGACSNIESIDSGGEDVDSAYCCYDVTKRLDGLACQPPTPTRSTVTSRPGSVGHGVTTGVGGAGGVGGVATGPVGTGGASCDALGCGFASNQPLAGCLECAASSVCRSQSDACSNDDDCVSFENCFRSCDPNASVCFAGCRSSFASGAALFDALLQCTVCGVCPVSCEGSTVQEFVTCGGGDARR